MLSFSVSKSLLSLFPVGFAVDRTAILPDRVIVAVHARAAVTCCPLCRCPSRRVHSRHVRRLDGLLRQGRLSPFDIQVCRFHCGAFE